MYVRRDATSQTLSAILPKEMVSNGNRCSRAQHHDPSLLGRRVDARRGFLAGLCSVIYAAAHQIRIGVVLSLWALAVIAFWKTSRHSLALFATAWGLATLVFGMTQIQLMPGPFHWIVEVAHLGVGVVAIALGAQLANAITLGRTPAGRVAERA